MEDRRNRLCTSFANCIWNRSLRRTRRFSNVPPSDFGMMISVHTGTKTSWLIDFAHMVNFDRSVWKTLLQRPPFWRTFFTSWEIRLFSLTFKPRKMGSGGIYEKFCLPKCAEERQSPNRPRDILGKIPVLLRATRRLWRCAVPNVADGYLLHMTD